MSNPNEDYTTRSWAIVNIAVVIYRHHEDQENVIIFDSPRHV